MKKAKIWNIENVKFLNKEYPNFKPAPYIVFLNTGYLNGGSCVRNGQIMKLVGEGDTFNGGGWSGAPLYQGFYDQTKLEYGNTGYTDEDVQQKGFSGVEQYHKIQGNWFRPATAEEAKKLESWIKQNKTELVG